MTPPTLRTDRLVLAAPCPDDWPALAAMWAEPAVHRPIGMVAPPTPEEVWHRLLRYIGHWQAVGHGTWMVRHHDDGRFVGEVGLMDARRAADPPLPEVPEAGWALAGGEHGRGLAGEALGAMLDWADARGIACTACLIAAANAPSRRLAVRHGYRAAGEVAYRGATPTLFVRDTAAVRTACEATG